MSEVLTAKLVDLLVVSKEKGISATFKGLPSAKEAIVLFEDRTVPIHKGQLEDSFGWLGVHIYKIRCE